MKKLHLIIFIIFTTFFISCEKGSLLNKSEETIIGDWEMTELVTNDGNYEIFGLDSYYFNYTAYATEMDVLLSFSEDPNQLKATGSYTLKITAVDYSESAKPENDVVEDIRIFDFFDTQNGWKIEDSKYLYDHAKGSNSETSIYFSEIESLNKEELVLQILDIKSAADGIFKDRATYFATFTRKR